MNFIGFRKLAGSRDINSQVIFNLLSMVIVDGIAYVMISFFTRVLGPDGYGLVTLYTTWVQILTILTGIQVSGTISTAGVHFPQADKEKYLSSVFGLSSLSFAAVSALVLIFIKPISAFTGFSWPIIVMMLLQGYGMFTVATLNSKFIYSKEAQKNCLISVIVCLSTNILSVVLVLFWPDAEYMYVGRMLGFAFPYALIGGLILLFAFRKGKTFYSKIYWKYCLTLCLPLIFHSLSQIILAQSDRVMIQKLMEDNAAVGIYGFIGTLVHILNVLYTALNNSYVPFFYEGLQNRDERYLKKSSANYRNLFTLLVLGFLLVSKEFVMLMSSKEYWSGLNVIPILVIGSLFVFLYSFPVNYEFYLKNSKSVAIGTCCSAVVNIVLNWFLIRSWGMIGAAVATAAAYIFLFVFHHIIAKIIDKEGQYRFSLWFYLKSVIPVLAGCVLFYLLFDLWPVRWLLAVADGLYILYSVYKRKSIF